MTANAISTALKMSISVIALTLACICAELLVSALVDSLRDFATTGRFLIFFSGSLIVVCLKQPFGAAGSVIRTPESGFDHPANSSPYADDSEYSWNEYYDGSESDAGSVETSDTESSAGSQSSSYRPSHRPARVPRWPSSPQPTPPIYHPALRKRPMIPQRIGASENHIPHVISRRAPETPYRYTPSRSYSHSAYASSSAASDTRFPTCPFPVQIPLATPLRKFPKSSATATWVQRCDNALPYPAQTKPLSRQHSSAGISTARHAVSRNNAIARQPQSVENYTSSISALPPAVPASKGTPRDIPPTNIDVAYQPRAGEPLRAPSSKKASDIPSQMMMSMQQQQAYRRRELAEPPSFSSLAPSSYASTSTAAIPPARSTPGPTPHSSSNPILDLGSILRERLGVWNQHSPVQEPESMVLDPSRTLLQRPSRTPSVEMMSPNPSVAMDLSGAAGGWRGNSLARDSLTHPSSVVAAGGGPSSTTKSGVRRLKQETSLTLDAPTGLLMRTGSFVATGLGRLSLGSFSEMVLDG
ncbi:hypothetical protein C8J57DRAFT_1300505 [Mycena rebaudengoi]|nr:hypothetical protein C8J57DRAFT_1300505 [Mycena rebaudengoi]